MMKAPGGRGEAVDVTAESPAELSCKVPDLVSVPLSDIRPPRTPVLAEAVHRLITELRRGRFGDSVQEQRE
ncbi:hypothetical protein FHS29_003385 [Saccharothrix tamanrassetensis]|uniref:Uncharacterized protein n=1 Tax=Saccharothrix tamanrassetensis TaxID=1051531 RepID=A0A841CE27_9PSEU|nr:hypothetical protein [Saccharothrix tamanrassetensis]MBB5956792.1 hypothetical protein [Saccharothrix tamanrassetensis]